MVFALFLGLTPGRIGRIGVNFRIGNKLGSAKVVRAAKPGHPAWNLCRFEDVELALVRVRGAGSIRNLYIDVLSEAWRWIAVVGFLLTAWWFGVASYGFYDHFRAEPDLRGGLGVALLLAALFLMVGTSTVMIRLLGRTSGGSGTRDGILG